MYAEKKVRKVGGGSGLTIAMWLKLHADNNYMGLVNLNNIRNGRQQNVDIIVNNPSEGLFYNTGNSIRVQVTDPIRFPLNTWCGMWVVVASVPKPYTVRFML